MRWLYRYVEEGEKYPWWMGLAYRRLAYFDSLGVLWPFNWAVRWAMNLWVRLRLPRSSSFMERKWGQAYHLGFEKGLKYGKDAAWRKYRAERGIRP